MKIIITKGFEYMCQFGVFVFLIGGLVGGYSSSEVTGHGFIGAIFGLIGGLIAAVVVFGLLFLVMEIRDNTRKTVEAVNHAAQVNLRSQASADIAINPQE